jgi:hypothetical protein
MGELLLAIFAIGAMGFYWGRNQPWVRWVLGLPPRVVTSSAPQFSPADLSPLAGAQLTLESAQHPIATPQIAPNDAVVVGPEVAHLAALTGDDPVMLQGAIAALARLVAAEQATQTAAIKIGLGVPPGSRSPRYEAAKAALLAEVGVINGPGEIVGFMPDPENNNRHVPVRV